MKAMVNGLTYTIEIEGGGFDVTDPAGVNVMSGDIGPRGSLREVQTALTPKATEALLDVVTACLSAPKAVVQDRAAEAFAKWDRYFTASLSGLSTRANMHQKQIAESAAMIADFALDESDQQESTLCQRPECDGDDTAKFCGACYRAHEKAQAEAK